MVFSRLSLRAKRQTKTRLQQATHRHEPSVTHGGEIMSILIGDTPRQFTPPPVPDSKFIVHWYAEQFVEEQYQHSSLREFVEQFVADTQDRSLVSALRAEIRRLQAKEVSA